MGPEVVACNKELLVRGKKCETFWVEHIIFVLQVPPPPHAAAWPLVEESHTLDRNTTCITLSDIRNWNSNYQ